MSNQGLTFITDDTVIVQGDFQSAPRLQQYYFGGIFHPSKHADSRPDNSSVL
jgi:hypothetical protein